METDRGPRERKQKSAQVMKGTGLISLLPMYVVAFRCLSRHGPIRSYMGFRPAYANSIKKIVVFRAMCRLCQGQSLIGASKVRFSILAGLNIGE